MYLFQSISPQLESYLTDRTGGRIDQAALTQQYSIQLEGKLRERDAFWEQRIEELKLSLASVQGQLHQGRLVLHCCESELSVERKFVTYSKEVLKQYKIDTTPRLFQPNTLVYLNNCFLRIRPRGI